MTASPLPGGEGKGEPSSGTRQRASRIADLLTSAHQTLATVECAIAGALGAALTDVAGRLGVSLDGGSAV